MQSVHYEPVRLYCPWKQSTTAKFALNPVILNALLAVFGFAIFFNTLTLRSRSWMPRGPRLLRSAQLRVSYLAYLAPIETVRPVST